MLLQIRPYCGIIVYLLLVCYGGAIGKQTLYNMYYSVAYTAQVLNTSADFWNSSEVHNHSQEVALIQLNSFQEAQEEDHTDEQETSTDVPSQKLKYFNHIQHSDFEELLINKRKFLTTIFKPGHFKANSSPPPRS